MNTNELLEQLGSPDELKREEAQEELNLRMDDEIARAILALAAGSGPDEVRSDAMIALGPIIEECGMDYDDALPEIEGDLDPSVSRETFREIVRKVTEIYRDESQPKLLRRRALEVLVRDPLPELAAEIRRHFISQDEDWRRTAMFAMGMMTGFEREIAATVETAEGPLLYEAVRAAGRMEVAGAAPRIRELARTDAGDRDLRIAAIFALAEVDPESDDLLEELAESEDEEIAEAAAESLEELQFRERLAGDFDRDDEE